MTLLVATFVSNPQAPALTDALITRAAQALGIAGETQWLGKDVAADLVFESTQSPRALADAFRGAVEPYPVDVIVQPVAGRRK